jgi:hypothetical protein
VKPTLKPLNPCSVLLGVSAVTEVVAIAATGKIEMVEAGLEVQVQIVAQHTTNPVVSAQNAPNAAKRAHTRASRITQRKANPNNAAVVAHHENRLDQLLKAESVSTSVVIISIKRVTLHAESIVVKEASVPLVLVLLRQAVKLSCKMHCRKSTQRLLC